MRTTVDLDDELFRKAKIHAAFEGIPLKTLFERAVRLALEKPQPKRRKVKLPLFYNKTVGKLSIPDDVAGVMYARENRERYEASL